MNASEKNILSFKKKKKKVFHNINYIQENKAQEAANLKNSSLTASLSPQSPVPWAGLGVPVLFGVPLSGGPIMGPWVPWLPFGSPYHGSLATMMEAGHLCSAWAEA